MPGRLRRVDAVVDVREDVVLGLDVGEPRFVDALAEQPLVDRGETLDVLVGAPFGVGHHRARGHDEGPVAALRQQQLAGCLVEGAGGRPLRVAEAVRQAAREFLLAQSSDWAFIMKTGTMVPYAVNRTREHITNFTKLHDDINAGTIDEWWLSEIEQRNNIFPTIDPLAWAD